MWNVCLLGVTTELPWTALALCSTTEASHTETHIPTPPGSITNTISSWVSNVTSAGRQASGRKLGSGFPVSRAWAGSGTMSPTLTLQTIGVSMARKGPSQSRFLKQGWGQQDKAPRSTTQERMGDWGTDFKSAQLMLGESKWRKGKKVRPQPSSTEVRPFNLLLCLVKEWRKGAFTEARRLCDSMARNMKAQEWWFGS